ncbi:MAG: AAA family ATPase [Gemmataceae bacterium]|nr:AAA family ATPase [Gemmataceae bacterium]
MQRIVICDPNDISREHMRALLLGIDFAFLDAECKRYDAFVDIIADNPPDLAIVHLDADKAKAAALLSQVSQYFPQVPLLVVSSNHAAILEALQSGAKQFLTEPVSLEDLLRVIRKSLAEGGSAASSSGAGPLPRAGGQSYVYAVLGARGGIGSTTCAVNLAAALAADPENQVALVDLDLALGDAGVHLSVSPNYTLADLAANIDKLDLNFLKRSMVKHEETGLSFLDRPTQVSDIDVIEGAHVDRVLSLLKLSYSHLVIDISKRFTAVDAAALAVADQILLVTQLELSSVLNATRILAALAALDEAGDRVKIILNKAGAEADEDERHRISPKKAEDIIGKPFYWSIPYEPKPLGIARNEGVPLIKSAPKCRANQAFVALAAALTNKQVAATPQQQQGGLFRGLFKK